MAMILVSKCCLGAKCRYNQKGYLKKRIISMMKQYDILGICPEMLGGLKVPREGCLVQQDNKVKGKKTNKDYTKAYRLGAERTVQLCLTNNIKKAYLLRGSPSCGKGYGLTAKLLEKHGIRVIAI